jgi:hypothetical protein
MTAIVTMNPLGKNISNHKVMFNGTGLAHISIRHPESTLLKVTAA